MDSTRQQKFAKLILKELSGLFQSEGKHFYGSAFVTVTHVRISPDLSIATVQVSLYRNKDAPNVVKHMNDIAREIRHKLGMRIKNQIRHIPELRFFIDDSLEFVDKIEGIFKNISDKEKK